MKKTMPFIFIIVFALLVIAITPFAGSTKIPFSVLKHFDLTVTAAKIFYQIRLPRVCTAFLAGAALACCGVALQAMFRNPLATPFTLGISGGAAFGAAIYVIFAASLPIGDGTIVFSFACPLLAVLLVYGLTRIKKGFSVGTMLLAGITLFVGIAGGAAFGVVLCGVIFIFHYSQQPVFWGTIALFFACSLPAVLLVCGLTRIKKRFSVGTTLLAGTTLLTGITCGVFLGEVIYVIFAKWLAVSCSGVVFSFAGSLAAVLLVYGLTKTKKGFSTGTMLLAGIAVNFFFSSLILFLQYISDFTQSFRIIHWLMGSVDVTGYSTPLTMLFFTAAGIIIITAQGSNLNLMSISDEIAITRGVDVKNTRKIIFLATSIMVAAVVAFCGPIGFVGLMAPHICRLLVGPDHKILTPASVLFGGAFLALCDTIARTLIAPAEIPVGVITALLGGPFFVWLLLKDTDKSGF